MKMHRRAWGALAGGLCACAVVATAYSAVSEVIAVGTMAHSELVGGPATVTMRKLTIAPGEVLPWHYHPGAGAFTVVTSGVLNLEDGCGSEVVYTPGQAFLESPYRVHRGKNLTSEPVVTAQTFIVPAGEGTTVQTGQQFCGAPRDRDECRGGGWEAFDFPRNFANQGDCLQYVIKGR
ncbi:MAG: cupin domain-containing protein [Gammaproteobacteria bacterium]|nr:cupin domain-containing protein [Gammaproteobacteria bacterium]